MKIGKFISGSVAALLISSTLYAKEVNQKVYAKVNGYEITQADVALLLKGKVNLEQLPKQTQKQIIDQLIERKLLAIKALNSDIVKSKEYKQTLQKTIQNLKLDLALQLWANRLMNNIKISDNELKNYYEQNKYMFKVPPSLHARHILVKTKKEAQQIIDTLKKAKNVKAKFIELAKSKSIGPSGKNGGDLGWFTPDKMVPEFSNAAMLLKKGEFSKTPVKTQFGYHIIYLEDKKPSKTLSFNEIKEQLKQRLIQEKFSKKLKEIIKKEKAKAKIKYNF